MVAERDTLLAGLIQQYGTMIRAAVAQVVGRRDEDLGDEVLQRVAEALWKQLCADNTIEHPASYLYRCAVRETVRLVRREVARGEVPLESAVEVVDAGAGPDGVARTSHLAAATDRVLTGLTDERAAAARAHLAGFEVEEIMRMYGWPYQKARNLIARGMSDLRAGLQALGLP